MLQMILIMAIIHHFFCKWYRVDLIFLFRPHHEGEDKTPATDLSDACHNVPVADMDNIRVCFFALTGTQGLEMLSWGIQWQCQTFMLSCGYLKKVILCRLALGWVEGWVYQVMPESDNEEPPLSAHPSWGDPGWLLITFQFIIAVRPITG